jgi:FixJ family two-component response regulator
MATKDEPKLVAIVDDDESIRSSLLGLMKALDFRSEAFESAEEYLKSGQQRNTACLITDLRLPGISGLELQSKLNADRHRIPIIFITGHGDENVRMQALRAGAVEFLMKPFDDQAMIDSIRAALES